MGLALVKQIVLARKGRVWAESSGGQGSTFHFTLPMIERSQAETSTAPDLVIIEADPSFATLLREHFERCGLKVQVTGIAKQAMEWILRRPPRMVLLDLHLAGEMDGWDLLVTLRSTQQLRELPILVISGRNSKHHGLALGGAEYVLKTTTREEFLAAVRCLVPELDGKQILIATTSSLLELDWRAFSLKQAPQPNR